MPSRPPRRNRNCWKNISSFLNMIILDSKLRVALGLHGSRILDRSFPQSRVYLDPSILILIYWLWYLLKFLYLSVWYLSEIIPNLAWLSWVCVLISCVFILCGKNMLMGKAYFITFCEATDFVKKLLNNCLKAYNSQD